MRVQVPGASTLPGVGYSANHPVEALYDPGPLKKATRDIAQGMIDLAHEEVVKRTPIADKPSGHSMTKFVLRRGGRKPGTLRKKWKKGKVFETLSPQGNVRYVAEESNDDEVWKFVEYDTSPHEIPLGGAAAGKTLVWLGAGGVTRFAKSVKHPGTTGQHMTRDGLAATDVLWQDRVGRPIMERWAAEQKALLP